MSVATIFDSYDAQMMDYSGDIDDDPMQAANSSEAWFQTEAEMDDDGHHREYIIPHTEGGEEVDMEPYYALDDEMLDGSQVEGRDIVDVEVVDVSGALSPVLEALSDPIALPADSPSGLVELLGPSDEPSVPLDPVDVRQDLDHNSDIIGTSKHEIIEPSQPSQSVSVSSHAGLTSELVEGIPDSVVFHAADSDEPSTFSDVQVSSTTVQEVTAPEVPEGLVPESSDGGVYKDDEHQSAAQANKAQEHDAPDAHADLPGDKDYDAKTSVKTGSPSDRHDTVDQDDLVIVKDTGGDPHEISEGVYIDPPPPVLLCLSSASSDRHGFSLFNHPVSRSNSSSPPPGTVDPSQEVLKVLLQHRPTLYFQPLTEVFEALRQEDMVAQVDGLMEGELAINAYDLQLVVPEDNVYAHEVTLHDLNVLHDGSDLHGPLRIKLQSIVPRFIVRYHALKAEIARLNLAAEQPEDEITGVPDSEHHEEASYDEYPQTRQDQEDQVDSTQHDDSEPQYRSEGFSNQDEQKDHADHLADYQGQEGDHDAHTKDKKSEHHQVHGTEAPALIDENVHPDVDAAEEFVDDVQPLLDADEDHTAADTDASGAVGQESTEYQQFTEPHEEYDDDYDDQLVQEQDEHDAIAEFEGNEASAVIDASDSLNFEDGEELASRDHPAVKDDDVEDQSEFASTLDGDSQERDYHIIDYLDDSIGTENVKDSSGSAEDADSADILNNASTSSWTAHHPEVAYDEINAADSYSADAIVDNYEPPLEDEDGPEWLEIYENDDSEFVDGDVASANSDLPPLIKTSKRHFDQIEPEDDRTFVSPPTSPYSKRPRVQ